MKQWKSLITIDTTSRYPFPFFLNISRRLPWELLPVPYPHSTTMYHAISRILNILSAQPLHTASTP